MKQFSLEEFKKNPQRKVVTRSGMPVRILCTDAVGRSPIVGLINFCDKEVVDQFMENGSWFNNGVNYDRDLFFAPEKKEGWVSVYRNERGAIFFSTPYSTKEEALDALYDDKDTRIDTIKVEWEE